MAIESRSFFLFCTRHHFFSFLNVVPIRFLPFSYLSTQRFFLMSFSTIRLTILPFLLFLLYFFTSSFLHFLYFILPFFFLLFSTFFFFLTCFRFPFTHYYTSVFLIVFCYSFNSLSFLSLFVFFVSPYFICLFFFTSFLIFLYFSSFLLFFYSFFFFTSPSLLIF